MRWDIFCRVIDNFGDIGVCWRLAADLGGRGETVRLWTDDASALAWMAPHGAAGVSVQPWEAANGSDSLPGDVVIEAFGCDLPPPFVSRMGGAQVWINLEYLSAEAYVERSHGLPSPQPNGLVKRFFYPGFTERTGGLIREPGMMQRRAAFQPRTWLSAIGVVPAAGERLVSLFCYDGAPVQPWLDRLADRPTLVLATPGAAQRAMAVAELPPQMRQVALPWLSQADFDHLLWACDLNMVRGEDSFVRAQWAGAPFVWQIYPQHDGVHAAKLDAFLDRLGATLALRSTWHAWNGLAPWPDALPAARHWAADCLRWREKLLGQDDLSAQLFRFVRQKG